jgi:regulator of RNase E activity RraA
VGQASFTRVTEVQVPVTVNVDSELHGGLAAVTVNSGNLLVENDNGVMCVPKLLEMDVLRVAFQSRD